MSCVHTLYAGEWAAWRTGGESFVSSFFFFFFCWSWESVATAVFPTVWPHERRQSLPGIFLEAVLVFMRGRKNNNPIKHWESHMFPGFGRRNVPTGRSSVDRHTLKTSMEEDSSGLISSLTSQETIVARVHRSVRGMPTDPQGQHALLLSFDRDFEFERESAAASRRLSPFFFLLSPAVKATPVCVCLCPPRKCVCIWD